VTNAVRAAHVDRLVNRSGPVRFPRVDSHCNVVVADQLERSKVVFGRMIILGARKVERHHAAVLVGHCELRHFEGRFGRDVPNAAEDDVGHDAVIFLCVPKAGQHGFDDGREPETSAGVEHG